MDPKAAERLLREGDPLRDAEAVANRLLAIDEAERVRSALGDAGISCQLRLIKPGEVAGRTDPVLRSSYSPLRPSWNVFVAPGDLARARAVAEERLRTDLDGRDDTADIAAGAVRPEPVPVCSLGWNDAWAAVERLGNAGIKAAVSPPIGDGPLDEQTVAVLVLPADVEAARRWLGPAAGGGV
ncbi:MAG TPA: hypothetical protein VK646_07725 [Actinomycetota bacterium]|nr:hypothetical protein [Actinomycetota bacterium]